MSKASRSGNRPGRLDPLLLACVLGASAASARAQEVPRPTPSPTPTATPTPAAPPELLVPDYNAVSDQQHAAPRPDNVPFDPELKGFIPIPGTQSMVRFGGSARVDAISDFRNNGNPNEFVPSGIPVPGQAGSDGGGHFTIQAKGSRISLEFRRPAPRHNLIRIYYENDFFGDASTASMSYRLRHFYAQVWNTLIGQTFTAFMNVDAWPDTVDYEGPNAQITRRQPQIRYTQPLARGKASRQDLFLSVEQPTSEVNTSASGFPAGTVPANPLPDLVLGYRVERRLGHLQLSAIGRKLAVESDTGPNASTFGWGVNLSGALNVAGRHKISYQVAYGEGIARYVNDLSGLNMDAGLDEKGVFKAIRVFAPLLGYTHYWSDAFRSTASVGYVRADPTASLGAFAVRKTEYAGLNLVWQPTKAFRTGLEYLHGWKETQGGSSRGGSRIDLVVRYDLVK